MQDQTNKIRQHSSRQLTGTGRSPKKKKKERTGHEGKNEGVGGRGEDMLGVKEKSWGLVDMIKVQCKHVKHCQRIIKRYFNQLKVLPSPSPPHTPKKEKRNFL